MIDGWGISCELALTWMSLDLTDDKSTLVQVMAWCCQATSHYLSQWWPRSLSPYGVTGPQWVNSSIAPSINIFMSSYSSLDTAVLQARVLSWISRITIGNFPHMWWVQCYNVSPNRVLASVRTRPKISARALGRFFRPKIERTLAFLDQCFL